MYLFFLVWIISGLLSAYLIGGHYISRENALYDTNLKWYHFYFEKGTADLGAPLFSMIIFMGPLMSLTIIIDIVLEAARDENE